MTTKQVKVVQIETVKGNKADRIVLHYVGSDGSTWKIGALAAKLDESSRKTLLAAKKDDILAVNLVKEGNYWNLTSAAVADSTNSPAPTAGYSKTSAPYSAPVKSKETDTRIQVMNALTNAIVSLGAGKTTKEYKDRVLEFVLLGNDVVDTVLAGNLEALASGAATSLDTSDDVVDEIGF